MNARSLSKRQRNAKFIHMRGNTATSKLKLGKHQTQQNLKVTKQFEARRTRSTKHSQCWPLARLNWILPP